MGSWASEYDNSRQFSGTVDEVSIWSRSFMNWEVYEMMHYPFNITYGDNPDNEFSAEGLYSYWNFDDMHNDSIYNLTGLKQTPEIMGEGAVVSFLQPKFAANFHVVSHDNQPFSGKILIDDEQINLSNGFAEYSLGVGNYTYLINDSSDESVFYGEFQLCCSATDTIFVDLSKGPQVFYSQGDSAFNSLQNWNSMRNGEGSAPINFNDSTHQFVIQNNHNLIIEDNISVSGEIILMDNSVLNTGGNFQINTGMISMNDGATMIIHTETSDTENINFNYISNTGKLIINSSEFSIPAGKYGDVEINLSEKNDKVRMKADISVNNLTITNGIFEIDDNVFSLFGDINVQLSENKQGRLKTNSLSEMKILGSSNLTTLPEMELQKLVLMREEGLSLSGMLRVDTLELINGNLYTSDESYVIVKEIESTENHTTFSYIAGPMARYISSEYSTTDEELFFPTGTINFYKPFSLNLNADEAGIYKVEVIEGMAPVDNLPDDIEFINKDYYIKIDLISDIRINASKIRMFYCSHDGVYDTDNLRIVFSNYKEIVNLGGHGNTDIVGSILSENSFNQGGIFMLGNALGNSEALPVDWLNIEAEQLNDHINIEWTTATEINNKGFYVQRSYDAVEFENIGFLYGQGTTSEINTYHFKDIFFDNAEKVVYYRIMQEDFDGTLSYSQIVDVILNTNSDFDGYWFVNNSGQAMLRLISEDNTEAKLAIYNSNASLVSSKNIALISGINDFPISLNNAGSGILILEVSTDNHRKSFKIPVIGQK